MSMSDPDLAFFVYTFNGDFIGEFTNHVRNYEHEHIEGPYRASWVFEQEEGVTQRYILENWFDSRIMNQVEVRYKGATCWKGFIWELELQVGKVIRTKSMTDVANAVIAKNPEYSEDEGNDPYIDFYHAGVDYDDNSSYWMVNKTSIAEYGRHEELLTSNGSDGEALELAMSHISRSAEPFNPSVVLKPEETANTLRISAVGRMVIANKVQLLDDQLRYDWTYYHMSHGDKYYIFESRDSTRQNLYYSGEEDDSEWTVSHEIARIISLIEYTTGWLYPISISPTNDTPTRVGSQNATKAFDRLLELVELRNQDEEYYRMTIDYDGGVIYEKLHEDTPYVLRTADIGVTYPDGTVPKWEAKPGIIKSIVGSYGIAMPNTYLSDSRLIPIERVSMRDGDEVASFHGRNVDAGDEIRALIANNNWLEQE